MSKTKEDSVALEQRPTSTEILRKPRSRADSKEIIASLIKEETRMVKGRFRCFECPGGSLRVQIKKYKDVPMYDATMTDGEVYEVPLFVARHLNGIDVSATAIDGKVGTCSYPVHGFKWENGQPMPGSMSGPDGAPVPNTVISKRVSRFGFESLEFGM